MNKKEKLQEEKIIIRNYAESKRFKSKEEWLESIRKRSEQKEDR